MDSKPLSPREEQIVALAVDGKTNEGIAHELGLSLSTVNTYWVRIRLKARGDSRTAVVAGLIRDKAEAALRASNLQKADLVEEIARREHAILDLNSALSLLQLAMDQLRSAVWATDVNLRVTSIANGEIRSFHTKMDWEVGKTIHEVFRTEEADHEAVRCHTEALMGGQCEGRLQVNGETLHITVRPLKEEDETVIGCIGVMTSLRGDA